MTQYTTAATSEMANKSLKSKTGNWILAIWRSSRSPVKVIRHQPFSLTVQVQVIASMVANRIYYIRGKDGNDRLSGSDCNDYRQCGNAGDLLIGATGLGYFRLGIGASISNQRDDTILDFSKTEGNKTIVSSPASNGQSNLKAEIANDATTTTEVFQAGPSFVQEILTGRLLASANVLLPALRNRSSSLFAPTDQGRLPVRRLVTIIAFLSPQTHNT